MYKLKTCKSNKVIWNLQNTLSNTSLRQKSECDTFYHVELISADDNQKCVAVVDPILMLFNQERLAKLGADTVESWIKSMEQTANSALNNLRSKCKDEDLISLVKSRHLQQPSELHAWIDYMSSHMDKFKELYAAEIADQKAKKAAEIDVQSKQVQPKQVEV